MKKLFLLMILSIFTFAMEQSFLDPEDAFKTSITKVDNGVQIQLKLGKDIYLYDEKLKVLITKPQKIDITKEIGLPKPVKYEEYIVHFDDLDIIISDEFIKSKVVSDNYTIQLQYQGCSKAGLCYAPMSEELSFELKSATAMKTKKVDKEQSFLDPEEAIQPSIKRVGNDVNFQLKLGKDIYLYDDKLKVLIIKPTKIDITKEVGLPNPVKYEEFIVHFDDINITITDELIKSKINSDAYTLQFQFQGCSKAGLCYAPMSENFEVDLKSHTTTVKDTTSTNNDLNETDTIANTLKNQNAIWVLLTFFGFGLLLALTPCVFPMIPILSSIIVKAGRESEMTAMRGFMLSLVYVLSMSLAYTIAGVLAGLFGANLQVALQNPYVLTVFAAIFVALAFSMFGYYKIELPQSLQNKIQSSTNSKQGVAGIAVMGFLSALIVGPCVAPPLAGALVYIGQTGDAILGGAALFVLSLGMGVPLLLIGLGAGKFMPQPGGWMESITKIFGIVMLAIAIWMLDRVLEPIYVMFLWAFLFIGAGLYLKMYEHIIVRLLTTVIFIYGVLTFIGAVSGASNVLNPLEKLTSKTVVGSIAQNKLEWIYVKNNQELDAAIASSTKPVMLDFYADWCVSCKELEGITFKDATVIQKLQGFTLLKADVTKNTDDDKALQKRFGVVGPPALIFWDTNKNEIKSAQIVGYKNPEDFLEIVNKYF